MRSTAKPPSSTTTGPMPNAQTSTRLSISQPTRRCRDVLSKQRAKRPSKVSSNAASASQPAAAGASSRPTPPPPPARSPANRR